MNMLNSFCKFLVARIGKVFSARGIPSLTTVPLGQGSPPCIPSIINIFRLGKADRTMGQGVWLGSHVMAQSNPTKQR